MTPQLVALGALLALTPGAPGVGDPYFPQAGNGGYDVANYAIDLAYQRPGISGSTTVTARAKTALTSFNLDFTGLKISSLTVDGMAAKYRRVGQELTVTPAKPLKTGAGFTVRVAYAGTPATAGDLSLGESGWLPSPDGAVTLSEPTGSSTWFPVNDHPTDKATFSFRVKVPQGLRVLANGEPQGDRWVVKEPMAPYLAFVAIGRWTVKESVTPGGIRSIVAADPALHADIGILADRVAQATDWGVEMFGPYPFTSTGAVVDDLITGYALETQNRPFLSSNQNDLETIVHEIAHQWFGDSVSVRQWKDIWLNEGFASYAEWLWSERHGGRTAQQIFDRLAANGPEWRGWAVPPGDPGAARLFDGPGTYQRGPMAVHAIRRAMGDAAFFQLLKAWPARYRHGNATIADLRALAEQLAGKDLSVVFRDWLYTARKPSVAPPGTV